MGGRPAWTVLSSVAVFAGLGDALDRDGLGDGAATGRG
jgi:hypothetical protein